MLKKRLKRVLQDAGLLKRHPSQVVAPSGCPRFDCSRVVWQPDNFLIYHQHLQRGSVHYDPGQQCWVVLGYGNVLEALKQDEWFSNEYTAQFDPFLAGSNSDYHHSFRLAMRSAMSFDQQDLKNLVNDWMDRFLERPKAFEAVGEFGVLLPRSFTAHLLGLTEAEVNRIVAKLASRRTDMDFALEPVGQVLNQSLIDIKANPRRGVFSALVHDTGADRLSDYQIVILMRHLWFAGTVTLSTLLPASLLWLCRQPDLAQELRLNPDKLPHFISEVMRLESPTQFLPRKCVGDREFGGYHFSEGAMVRLCLAAANRDPAQYPDPDRLDLDRPPYRHLAFGFGEHICLGAMLAKTIAETSIHRILQGSSRIYSPMAENTLEYEKSLMFRGLRRLDVVIE